MNMNSTFINRCVPDNLHYYPNRSIVFTDFKGAIDAYIKMKPNSLTQLITNFDCKALAFIFVFMLFFILMLFVGLIFFLIFIVIYVTVGFVLMFGFALYFIMLLYLSALFFKNYFRVKLQFKK